MTSIKMGGEGTSAWWFFFLLSFLAVFGVVFWACSMGCDGDLVLEFCFF